MDAAKFLGKVGLIQRNYAASKSKGSVLESKAINCLKNLLREVKEL
jgi:hypothetical protein